MKWSPGPTPVAMLAEATGVTEGKVETQSLMYVPRSRRKGRGRAPDPPGARRRASPLGVERGHPAPSLAGPPRRSLEQPAGRGAPEQRAGDPGDDAGPGRLAARGERAGEEQRPERQ